MGWLRLVGSLKDYVTFAEYSLFHTALLQKRPIILRSLLIVATPYRLLLQDWLAILASRYNENMMRRREVTLDVSFSKHTNMGFLPRLVYGLHPDFNPLLFLVKYTRIPPPPGAVGSFKL